MRNPRRSAVATPRQSVTNPRLRATTVQSFPAAIEERQEGEGEGAADEARRGEARGLCDVGGVDEERPHAASTITEKASSRFSVPARWETSSGVPRAATRPPWTTAMRSQIASATGVTWVLRRTVFPAAA